MPIVHPFWLLPFAAKAVEPLHQCQSSIPFDCCLLPPRPLSHHVDANLLSSLIDVFSVQRPLSHWADANYAESYPAPDLYMSMGQDLLDLFSHITFLSGGTPWKSWFHWTDHKLSRDRKKCNSGVRVRQSGFWSFGQSWSWPIGPF